MEDSANKDSLMEQLKQALEELIMASELSDEGKTLIMKGVLQILTSESEKVK